MKSPTAHTLDYYRRKGFEVGIVERWIERAGIRKDLFHCIDLVAIRPGEPVLGIQATARSCMSARISKAKGIPALATWLSTGSRFVVIGWAKVGKRWEPRIVELQRGELGVEAVVTRTPTRKRRKSRYQPADLFGEDIGHEIAPVDGADASKDEPVF